MYKNLIPLILLTAAFASCSSDPVKVVIDKKDLSKGKITIDNKDQYTFKDSIITITVLPGKHTFSLNNEAAKDFVVGDNGGLLNVDEQEYVAYEIEYAEQASSDKFSFNSMTLKSVMLIDSFIIIPKNSIMMGADSSIRKILPKLQSAKNGNYFFAMGGGTNEYDVNEQIQGIKKLGKGKIYVDRFWDFTLGEKIPESLTIQTSKSISFGNSTTTRTSIMHADMFLLAAQLSPEEYTIKTIAQIQEGKEDKVKEKIKEESQMKF